jgi:hypothetical protein
MLFRWERHAVRYPGLNLRADVGRQAAYTVDWAHSLDIRPSNRRRDRRHRLCQAGLVELTRSPIQSADRFFMSHRDDTDMHAAAAISRRTGA